MKRYLEAGKIVRTHGIKGELCVEPWADSPEFLGELKRLYFDDGSRDAGLISSRVHKGQLLIRLEGVNSVEQGDMLRGKVLYLDREDVKLPEGRHFLQDILGLQTIDGNTGRIYGVLKQVLPTGANDVYLIVDDKGREYLFPAAPHMVKRISVEDGVIELLPIPGIFDEDGEEA